MLLSDEDGVSDQPSDSWARFAVIKYNTSSGQFVFYARGWYNGPTSYICQLQQQGLTVHIHLKHAF